MRYFGWSLLNSTTDKGDVLPQILSIVCKSMNLCASVGCACVTGSGEKLCDEITFGTRYPHFRSEGPHWTISATAIDHTIRVEVYYDGPMIYREVADTTRALGKLGHAVFPFSINIKTKF